MVTIQEWVCEIDPPGEFLALNKHLRKDKRSWSGLRRMWRERGWLAGRLNQLPVGLARVRIDGVVAPPHGRFDTQNLELTLKVLVDGLGPPFVRKPSGKSRGAAAPGYGLIPNDNARHLDGPHLHVTEPIPPNGHVKLYIVDLSGVPSGRTWTPDIAGTNGQVGTVKRACNGCGGRIGDVTHEETAAAIAGRPLPDVRHECLDCRGGADA